MDLLAISLIKPNGFWEAIIFGMENGVKNYALALILVTIIIKLVMVPLDFINKYTSKKSSRKQAEMKPELDKINAKYGNDKALLNQKTMECYKSHNFNIMGTCFGMLLYLVLTMVVFFTLFSSLNGISYYKISDQFLQVREAYFAAYDIDVNAIEGSAMDAYNLLSDEQKSAKEGIARDNAYNKFQDTKTSFLWIDNIWIADSAFKSPVMDYDTFIDKSSLTEEEVSAEEYELVMGHIENSVRKSNGFFVLALLAAGLNYLSISVNTWISRAKAKKQGIDPKLVSQGSNKIMTIVMPIIMGVFTLLYNAAFGLYIVAGALIALLTSPLVTMFVDMLEIEAIKKEQEKTVAVYNRKRRK